MLRRISKRVKEQEDKMRLSVVVRLSRTFWSEVRNGTDVEKLQIVMRPFTLMTVWCRITTLELTWCRHMNGQDTSTYVTSSHATATPLALLAEPLSSTQRSRLRL